MESLLPRHTLEHFICPNPFLYAELRSDGSVVPCCYLGTSFGNLHKEPLPAIWNSSPAQALRASILDGSYRFCDADKCAGMQKALWRDSATQPLSPAYQTPYELLLRDDLRDGRLPWIEKWTPDDDTPGPGIISLEDDPSCNLSCPSCRTAPFALPRGESARLEAAHSRIVAHLDEIGGEIWICGAGDPFASRAYRKLLREFDADAHPRIHLRIDTNGMLLTPAMWRRTLGRYPQAVSLLAVSVDAADAETYARLRRGGDWERLTRNLEFLGEMRLRHPTMRFILRMIVQRDNFLQMPAFVALAQRFHADMAVFSRLDNWGASDSKIWQELAVHRPQHPRFAQLLDTLRVPALHSSNVDLGNLTTLAHHVR